MRWLPWKFGVTLCLLSLMTARSASGVVCPLASKGGDSRIFLDHNRASWTIWVSLSPNPPIGIAASESMDRILEAFCPWAEYVTYFTSSDPISFFLWTDTGPPPDTDPLAMFLPLNEVTDFCGPDELGNVSPACADVVMIDNADLGHLIVNNWTMVFVDDFQGVPGAPEFRYFKWSFESYPALENDPARVKVHFLSIATHEAGHCFGAGSVPLSCSLGSVGSVGSSEQPSESKTLATIVAK